MASEISKMLGEEISMAGKLFGRKISIFVFRFATNRVVLGWQWWVIPIHLIASLPSRPITQFQFLKSRQAIPIAALARLGFAILSAILSTKPPV